MNNKKILIIGSGIIFFSLIIVVFLVFSSDIFGIIAKNRLINKLESISEFDYVLINDNRSENYFGGEYIETDVDRCRLLTEKITSALKESEYDGTRNNFLGGFALILRISRGDEEIRLWLYEDKIEFENGSDIVMCRTADSSVFNDFLTYTLK